MNNFMLQADKMHREGDFEYPKSLDQLIIWRGSWCSGEDNDSAVGPHEDQFSNLEATLFGQSGDRIPEQSAAYRRSPQLMAWK